MTEQIERIEVFGLDREALRPGQQMGNDEVLRVFDQLFLREPVDEIDDRPGADQRQREASRALDQRMRTLEQDAQPEDLMDASFIHFYPNDSGRSRMP